MTTSAQQEATNESHRKFQILAAARELGFGWYIEERLNEDVDDLVWLLGVVAMNATSRKRSGHTRAKTETKIGRPKKLRSELKPVQLYLQVRRLQEFFENSHSISLSQRDTIKLLIKYGEIPPNSELNHIEKQVSAGKKAIDKMRKELDTRR
ncbi:hypothetical protein [uncultured Martelella sp.]|uniref:hypothetical protein n=1 Tax=uncultured Martelella sp. TaxID=392331 RepID=UPI0029C67B4B|nr:hypothetical protein [uncultured Martelella sp.]